MARFIAAAHDIQGNQVKEDYIFTNRTKLKHRNFLKYNFEEVIRNIINTEK